MFRGVRWIAIALVTALLTAGVAQAMQRGSQPASHTPEQAGLSAVWDWLAFLWSWGTDSQKERSAVRETTEVDVSMVEKDDSQPTTEGGGHMDPNGSR